MLRQIHIAGKVWLCCTSSNWNNNDPRWKMRSFAGYVIWTNERARWNRDEAQGRYREEALGIIEQPRVGLYHARHRRQKECNKKNDTYPTFIWCYEEANVTIDAHYTDNAGGGIRCNPLIRVSTVYAANNELIFSCFPRLFPPSWLLNHTSTAALNRKLVWNPNAACTNRHCGGHVHSARLIYSHMGGLAIREAISARIHMGSVYTNSY